MTDQISQWTERGRWTRRSSGWSVALVLCATVVLVPIISPPMVQADQEQDPWATFKRGYVTAKPGEGGKSIQIDGVTYGMQPETVITDQVERPVPLVDIASGVKVFFHLDNVGKIDRLLIWIPS